MDRLTQTAKELSAATGRTCIPAQADVREPNMLKEAVEKTIAKFGRIDFVICGTRTCESYLWLTAKYKSLFRCCGQLLGSDFWLIREWVQDSDEHRYGELIY